MRVWTVREGQLTPAEMYLREGSGEQGTAVCSGDHPGRDAWVDSRSGASCRPVFISPAALVLVRARHAKSSPGQPELGLSESSSIPTCTPARHPDPSAALPGRHSCLLPREPSPASSKRVASVFATCFRLPRARLLSFLFQSPRARHQRPRRAAVPLSSPFPFLVPPFRLQGCLP